LTLKKKTKKTKKKKKKKKKVDDCYDFRCDCAFFQNSLGGAAEMKVKVTIKMTVMVKKMKRKKKSVVSK